MRKPSHVVYGVDEKPPPLVTALSGLQHVGVMSVFLLYPVLIARQANAPPEVAGSFLSMTLIGMAIATLLQDFRYGAVGSGYLCQPNPSVIYFVPSLIAAGMGGLPLVFGMTVMAGMLEMAMSRGLRRLRPIFPPEIVGLVILIVGIATGLVAFRLAFGDGRDGHGVQPIELVIGLVTLGLMVLLNVWGSKFLRIFCVLIGIVVGYVLCLALGLFATGDAETIAKASVIAFPTLGHLGWSVDAGLIVPFAVAAIAATLKVMGNVTTAQKASDADWVRPELTQVSGGVLADGLATTVSGLIGGHGLNSSPTVVGLASASGVVSRYVAYPVAAFLAILAFLPKVGALFYLMPRTVAGAALVFSSTFIIVNGLQVMTSRLLDTRKTLLIGLALMSAIAVDAQPGLVRLLPASWQPILGTSLVLGTVLGLALNLVFRIGMRRTQSIEIPRGEIDHARIERFLQSAGETWGARADVIERAKFNLVQSVETIMEGCDPDGALEVTATFDEFYLDIGVSYLGPLLELPERRPTNEEIIETDEGHRRLAGFMLRRYADRVSATRRSGRSTVIFHFDH